MKKGKHFYAIFVLIFFTLCSNMTCIAYANNNSDSKLTVFLSGDVIEKIQVNIELISDDPIIFVVPCNITNYNTKYDEKNFLFDSISYKNYSLCVVAPVGEITHFSIEISNEYNEVYEGISLNGTVTNGEYEMFLNIPIPTIEQKFQTKHYICQFATYSIMQVHPYSSITYSDDGRKVLTEELTGKELLLPISTGMEEKIVYAYSMSHAMQEESSSAFNIITIAVLPLSICVLQLLYPTDNKKKALSVGNIISYVAVAFLIGLTIYLKVAKGIPNWVFLTTLLILFICLICIIWTNKANIANIANAIKKLTSTFKRNEKKPPVESLSSEEEESEM